MLLRIYNAIVFNNITISQGFIPAFDNNKRHSLRAGIGIKLLNCADDYLRGLKKQINLIKQVGIRGAKSQQERIDNGKAYSDIGSFPTHHQKMILIDHQDEDNAVGFVQGFNLVKQYFDTPNHPYHDGINDDMDYVQDVGVELRGQILEDLYHNFKQRWELDTKGNATTTAVASLEEPIFFKTQGNHICQIIRTWRNGNEANIHDFYESSFDKINEFIYVEDQYFRMPEFAQMIKIRASEIKNNGCNKKDRLYLFVITNPNEEAAGESNVRDAMLKELSQGHLNADQDGYKKSQSNQEKLAKIAQGMQDQGVMVHICRLMTSKLIEKHQEGCRSTTICKYRSIYTHSKLTIFDNAYLTLGSANWNHRSMFTDSELNVVVQKARDDNKVQDFREKLWGEHTNREWTKAKKDGDPTKPKDWYEQWTELLSKNFKNYVKQKPLLMNLFPYYEDLNKLTSPFDPISRIKNTSG